MESSPEKPPAIALETSETRSSNTEGFVERLSIGFFFFLFGAYALAISGYFFRETISVLFGVVAIGMALLVWRQCRLSRASIVRGAAIILFSAMVALSASPTIFSGRDEGSYAGAAIRLAAEHSLISEIPSVSREFARLYGEGKALNIPGFFYTGEEKLVTQFPLGYSVWLGAFISIFGLAGISIANATTLALTIGALLSLLRKFVSMPFALCGTALAGVSFPILWISGRTLSENLALPLFILLAFHLVSFVKRPSVLSWAIVVSGSTLLFLTRIEGFLILPMAIVSIAFFPSVRDFFSKRFISALFPAVLVATTGIAAGIFFNLPFYRSIGKALLGPSSSNAESVGFPILSALFRNLEIFWTYGMISVVAMAILGVVFLISTRRWLALLPFFLAAPTLIYLVSPHISSDHPWLLRRFVFSMWPVTLFLAMIATSHLREKFSEKFPGSAFVRPVWFVSILFFLLAIPSLPATVSMLGTSENHNLLSDTKALSSNFSDRDVVFVDRLASGDPYSMIADPLSTLFGKNALYIFNPEDIARFDRSRFDRVFLIVQAGDETPYREALNSRFRFEEFTSFEFNTSTLSRETDPLRLPLQEDITATSMVFLLAPIF